VVFGYIPTIGALVSSVPPVILALLQLGPGRSGLVLLLLVVLNVAIGNFLEPQIFGKRLGLSTLAVFVSLVAWGWLWGPAGMLLSVPLTMVTKILLDNSTQWRWLGALLEPSLRPSRSQPPPLASRPRNP
jgi:AI-2 transport protein TqsA